MKNVLVTELRVFVYDFVFARGHLPKATDIAQRFGVPESEVKDWLRMAKVGKTLLVDSSGEIWMAGPFAARPTGHDVEGAHVRWWANCAWDALAVGILAREHVTIRSVNCALGESLTIVSPPDGPPVSDAVVHFLVPARHWYDDVGFT